MTPRVSRSIMIAASLIFMLAAFIPTIYATYAAGDAYRFGGFLLNPIDGNSYLAKMRLGWEGEWRFTLPYSAEKGEGAYLFLFYLFLGHLSRWLNLPLLGVFHAARFLAAIALLLSMAKFFRAVFPDHRRSSLAFLLASFGSGMGWMAALFGGFTSDFWVAEAYPFLSAYSNPHFPLSLALLLWIFAPPRALEAGGVVPNIGWTVPQILKDWWVGGLAFILAVIAPFGVVIALAVLLGGIAWSLWLRRQDFPTAENISRFTWIVLGGLPVLAYDLWVTARDAQLSAWNGQNLTPSPSPGDLLVSFFPLLLLAILGSGWSLVEDRRGRLDGWSGWRLPLSWLVMALLILYLPVNLQRRFIMGLYIPLSVLALPGIDLLARGVKRSGLVIVFLVQLLTLPTILVILLAARHGVETKDPQLYLSSPEALAIEWISNTTPKDALIMAAPDTGLFIPAHSGRRVLYGHPFETVKAEEAEQTVLGFYASQESARQLEILSRYHVDYVFFGPRERKLGGNPGSPFLQPAFQTGDVAIYSVHPWESGDMGAP